MTLLGDKQAVARKTTLTSIAVNFVMMGLQLSVGVVAHSQALVADGFHSLADLVSDAVVLIANRRGTPQADSDHNYGHSRYETVASLFLGTLLIAVGIGMLWRAGTRLADLDTLPQVHASALPVALLVLVAKETLFRYMLREAQRVRSALLIANAWHARSDAASSLMVAIGVLGSLVGVKLLDPIAAVLVGFMIARMGWIFGWNAIQDLSDRALDDTATSQIRKLLLATPGVRDAHELRTRKMGDYALVDAHILVDPVISVSEGHYIAEEARRRVLGDPRVLDALIHVDPENDLFGEAPAGLPARSVLQAGVSAALAPLGIRVESITVHYLRDGIEVEATLRNHLAGADATPLPDDLLNQVDQVALEQRLGVRRIRWLRALDSSGTSVARL